MLDWIIAALVGAATGVLSGLGVDLLGSNKEQAKL